MFRSLQRLSLRAWVQNIPLWGSLFSLSPSFILFSIVLMIFRVSGLNRWAVSESLGWLLSHFQFKISSFHQTTTVFYFLFFWPKIRECLELYWFSLYILLMADRQLWTLLIVLCFVSSSQNSYFFSCSLYLEALFLSPSHLPELHNQPFLLIKTSALLGQIQLNVF